MDALTRRALAHPRRTEILCYLIQHGDGEETELADSLGLALAVARYHLRVLNDADLIAHADGQGPGTDERYVATAPADL
jgi:predicted ArsR family transcriptional regulator